jgi:hypothetical protein
MDYPFIKDVLVIAIVSVGAFLVLQYRLRRYLNEDADATIGLQQQKNGKLSSAE